MEERWRERERDGKEGRARVCAGTSGGPPRALPSTPVAPERKRAVELERETGAGRERGRREKPAGCGRRAREGGRGRAESCPASSVKRDTSRKNATSRRILFAHTEHTHTHTHTHTHRTHTRAGGSTALTHAQECKKPTRAPRQPTLFSRHSFSLSRPHAAPRSRSYVSKYW